MGDPTNADRAARVAKLMGVYSTMVGEDEGETMVSSLLADIRHYCDAQAVDFDDCLRLSEIHHDTEVTEDEAKKTGQPG